MNEEYARKEMERDRRIAGGIANAIKYWDAAVFPGNQAEVRMNKTINGLLSLYRPTIQLVYGLPEFSKYRETKHTKHLGEERYEVNIMDGQAPEAACQIEDFFMKLQRIYSGRLPDDLSESIIITGVAAHEVRHRIQFRLHPFLIVERGAGEYNEATDVNALCQRAWQQREHDAGVVETTITKKFLEKEIMDEQFFLEVVKYGIYSSY